MNVLGIDNLILKIAFQDQVVYFENIHHRFMSSTATEKPQSSSLLCIIIVHS